MSSLLYSLSGSSADSNRTPFLHARALRIDHIKNRDYWKWVRQTDSTFMEAAELLKVWWLEVAATIKFNELSPETNYAAHLIFKTTSNSKGLDTFQEALVSVGRLQWKTVVCINPRVSRPRNKCIALPVRRADGWMELELGRFYCDDGTGEQEVEVTLTESDDEKEKSGLIIAGIQLRPF